MLGITPRSRQYKPHEPEASATNSKERGATRKGDMGGRERAGREGGREGPVKVWSARAGLPHECPFSMKTIELVQGSP